MEKDIKSGFMIFVNFESEKTICSFFLKNNPSKQKIIKVKIHKIVAHVIKFRLDNRNTFRTDVNVKAYENGVRKQPRPYENIHTVQVSQIYCEQSTWRFLGRKTSIHNFSCVVYFNVIKNLPFPFCSLLHVKIVFCI